ncbi:hypothetical protein AXG93_1154s1120 [Marchantia polymorpha subsp. ruderalis]|uniref:Reverse transcriptase domain-containing protein n=1 Tax=Marchantia polymorpha subsp. ruderalis TaxID=1480154 RepID=A0A176WR97_MARPO|nr:hypothetical protein AXG93_1154s1120 [Marchantia polymorpha subsp. ruderalis]
MGVFIEDSQASFLELRAALAKYEASSGAHLNLAKSSILLLGMDRPPDWLCRTGCVLMEPGTCRRVEQMYRHFLWGYNLEGKTKKALVRWEMVCRPKKQGGLGIRSLADTNASLMGKWIGTLLDDKAGAWGGALAEIVTNCRLKYNKNVVRREYSIQDLILTNQPLRIHNTDMGSALLASWKQVQKDLKWEPAGAAIPRHLTLCDIVCLLMNETTSAAPPVKLIMAKLRTLKITQAETIWTRQT